MVKERTYGKQLKVMKMEILKNYHKVLAKKSCIV